jgi:hypothetical protein
MTLHGGARQAWNERGDGMTAYSGAIAAELLALQTEDGLIHPAGAVRWARANPASKLYGALEWNDAVAAEAYRVGQVRSLIAICVVDASGDRTLISLSPDRVAGGYRPISDVLAAADLRDIMLTDALSELDRVKKKYDRLVELAQVWQAAEVAKARRGRKRAA